MSLMQQTVEAAANNMRSLAFSLMTAGPKIQAAEYLEQILRQAGFDAHAVSHCDAQRIVVHVVVHGEPRAIGETLLLHSVFFDKHTDQYQTVFDCSVRSYNIVLRVLPQPDDMAPTMARIFRGVMA
jgi:hypothetical protein